MFLENLQSEIRLIINRYIIRLTRFSDFRTGTLYEYTILFQKSGINLILQLHP